MGRTLPFRYRKLKLSKTKQAHATAPLPASVASTRTVGHSAQLGASAWRSIRRGRSHLCLHSLRYNALSVVPVILRKKYLARADMAES